ncbi:uncharacterized protein TRIADDRAFT_27830 [Trichoplax adhaerens]|uniref:Spliceosome-associated protein CWC27 homolog n=1 Tax=Trichoplax adhaerens TaxID=10228 RepID=B3S110_TRIAD|nr:hypothetical protein TRIADDRAFT_27830 [Trichoplax adhaerens]EDV23155.1 hypothetical protein TRIADDRAFT_27830 [Trichoplax adhaerens]|eukprot:XP_002114065.1 hypothetical protein TRIADDRAFT_27830 [Trichoplax adhaerens]
MSNIYITEPPTSGKVLVVTSCGDIDIELWSKEAPKACRNFIQLCMEGYYDSTVFHRVVKNFIIQGGDPTGTGQGGESIYGKSFQDEFHQRLRYTRRGLVGVANYGPNTNGSQFFFTLDRADELNGKNTIFGKVTGNTIYNVLKIAEVETDGNDRPLYPPKIIKTEVLANPFDDIVPRLLQKAKPKVEIEAKKQAKSAATKNFKLLSFGMEEEENDGDVAATSTDRKIRSSHDVLDDPKLSAEPAIESSSKRRLSDDEENVSEEYDNLMKERIRNKLQNRNQIEKPVIETQEKKISRTEELRKEAKVLMREIKKSRKQETVKDESDDDEDEEEGENEVMKEYREQQQKYSTNKNLRKDSNREKKTLEFLAKFQSKLQAARSMPSDNDSMNTDGKDNKMSIRLDIDNTEHKSRDPNKQDVDAYHIYDPRNPINKRRREKGKERR